MRARRREPRRRDAPRWDRAEWDEASQLLLRRCNGKCERYDHELTALERHHRQRRRDGGDRLSNLLALDPDCHAWVTAHPAAARSAGLIVSAHVADPGAVPVRMKGMWWLLSDDGTRRVCPPPAEPLDRHTPDPAEGDPW